MFFYPIHQSMGQITGTMLMAMGKTRIKSYVGIFFMIISIITAYIVLAPNDLFIPGLNLGASGLAIKMIACQFIEVNLMAFFISRFINTAYDWGHQLIVLFSLLPLGLLIKFFMELLVSILSYPVNIVFVMAASGVLYFICVALLVRFFPNIVGLNKEHISQSISWLKAKFA